ncbi:pentatricopeptide repeat-containing protein At1g19720-like [Syzygium oleosum]|uniref:pentatricopeptide repeat-containing protein At1g19720-like n=1 Tax=Syzygium oleosum TaxID=219896 RepID=UPI0024B88821|nr:pentatricopeptide repeat-containing protein At1g19720-like [Syzygium oleosum]
MSRSKLASRSLSLDDLNSLLQRCMKAKSSSLSRQAHAMLITTGAGRSSPSLSSTLVGSYGSCGDSGYAKLVFGAIRHPSVFALNWMVSISAFNGDHEEAFGYFASMQKLGRTCNRFTFSIVLKACIAVMDVFKGREIHGVVCRMYLRDDVSVANSLIDMYGKCGRLDLARKVFDKMFTRDVVSWTSMICGYCHAGKMEKAVELFERMRREGLEPNAFTWNAMIAGYARTGDRNGTMALLNEMKNEGLIPDLVTWNALISGFVQSNQVHEALKLFQEMLVSGVKPNQVTVTGLLPGCGSTVTINRGREIHGLIYRMGLDVNVYVVSALIDMYSKSGCVKDASNVFDMVTVKNVASWNAMIGCYGKHGMVDRALQLFEGMKDRQIRPNEVTLVSILSACSHGGLLEKGLQIFRSIKEDYGVSPRKEHYGCVVDLLCRCGRMTEAYNLLKEMPVDITDSMLGAFFNGCSIHGRNDLAQLVADDIANKTLKRPAGLVTLSNILAAGGGWEGVENVRDVMREKRIHKKPGYSWI